MLGRLAFVCLLGFAACNNDSLVCPSTEPPDTGYGTRCDTNGATCRFGAHDVCTCNVGAWYCQDERCGSQGGFSSGACTIEGLKCGGGFETPTCVCSMVCSSLRWVCFGGNPELYDLSTFPGEDMAPYDMCP